MKPHRNPGPTVKELRNIHYEMQENLELCAYEWHKFPKSQGNKADLKAFLIQKGKFQRSKKFRSMNHVMDDDDQNKVLQAQGIQVDQLGSRQGGRITRILASRMQRSSQSLGEVSAKITLLCKTNRSLTLFQAKCLAKPRKMRRSQILYTTLR